MLEFFSAPTLAPPRLAFVCSLRAGEIVGIDLNTVDFEDGSLWITRQVQRVSDETLEKLSKNEVIHIFPKVVARSKSSLVLISPKTDESARKLYLTAPLLKEIAQRVEEIKRCKDYLREEYQDQGLLICFPDGRPYDPKSLQKFFKDRQCAQG